MAPKRNRQSKCLSDVIAGTSESGEAKAEGSSIQVSFQPHICDSCERCARKRPTRYLPQEVVFIFLSHVQAHVLRNVMRHVCREWNLMINSPNFIQQQLQNSPTGILILPHGRNMYAIYVEMRRGCLEKCKLDLGFGEPDFGYRERVSSSCNGLVLFARRQTLHVSNPLTKQRVVLSADLDEMSYHIALRLVFVEASMKYKVLNVCGNSVTYSPPKDIAVQTIGVDRVWRRIGIEHLSPTARGALWSPPLVTGGYMHWVRIHDDLVLTLNIETETFCQFSVPQLRTTPRSRKWCSEFLPMGRSLSIVHKSSRFSREVWEMDPETGEWTMLLSFDMRPLKYRFTNFFLRYEKAITPIGWLAVGEVLIFSCAEIRCVAYNIKTREIQWFELDAGAKPCDFVAHVNSLVFLEGTF